MPPQEKKPAFLAPWPPAFGKTYVLSGGKNFKSITKEMGWKDPLALLWYNFRTVDPLEVNYYLHNYVGCTVTTPDGKNYKFHDADYPGVIYIPLDGREPAVCWETPYKETKKVEKLPKKPYQPEPEPKDPHSPRALYAFELAQLKIVEGHPQNLTGSGPVTIKVGDFKLAMKDIRRVISVSATDVVYMVIETDSAIGDSLYKGRVYTDYS